MQVLSLSYRTDLYFPALEGNVLDRDAYLVITTPKNPTYHWGNFQLFAEPPCKGDLVRWTELFRQEIGEPQQVGHAVFGIDGVTGDVGDAGAAQEFLDAGFELDRGVIMTARKLTPPPRPNRDITIRPHWYGAFLRDELIADLGLFHRVTA